MPTAPPLRIELVVLEAKRQRCRPLGARRDRHMARRARGLEDAKRDVDDVAREFAAGAMGPVGSTRGQEMENR